MEQTFSNRKLENADPARLRLAFNHCASITQRFAGNFRYAFKFLPVDQRNGIYALYSFCRLADDAADEDIEDPQSLLRRLENQLDICYQGLYNDKLTLALASTIRHFGLERIHFDDLLDGMWTDLNFRRYTTIAELEKYCYQVASTVGLHCIKIFGADCDESRLYARNLGIAMQLTNILRDIKEDFDRGRIYLPQEDLERFGFTDTALFSAENHDSLSRLVQWEAERAESYFKKADETLPKAMSGRLFVARVIGAIYRELLRKITSVNRHDQRIELSHWEKLHIACRTMIKG